MYNKLVHQEFKQRSFSNPILEFQKGPEPIYIKYVQ